MIRWQRWVLVCAGLHCLVWGVFIILLPAASAAVYGFAQDPAEIHLWQGSGLFILLLGIGFSIASRDPMKHWLMVLVGLLAKVLGATGMVFSVLRGQVSPDVLWLLPVNDLIWCWPLFLIVRQAIQREALASSPLESA